VVIRERIPSSWNSKENLLLRLRIGHIHLTHFWRIDHTDPPECSNCHQLLSVRCMLTECTSYNQTQRQYYFRTIIQDIFNHSPSKNITDFTSKKATDIVVILKHEILVKNNAKLWFVNQLYPCKAYLHNF